MNNNNLEEYLTYYLGLESPQYAVMIKGPWGCGKTFFVKNFLLKNKDEEIGDDTVINLKPIYISLYGMTTLENLREAIRAELNPLLYSKVAKFGKEVLKGLLKTTLRIDLDRNGDAKTDGAITGNIDTSAILTLVESDVSGTKALFLDDLERTNIDLEELFGFINNLVEHHSCKVILLADENRLIGKHKEYTKTKEKLVGPTFEIRRDIECIFKIFLEDAVKIDEKYKDIKKYLEENKEQIIEIYKTSQCENLRVFRWSIVDFFHFAKKFHYQLISKNENGKKYGAFMNYIVIIFFIAYLEHKMGNKDGVKYTSSYFIDDYLNPNDNEKKDDPIRKTNNKYKSILEDFGLYSLSSHKEIEIINDYLENQALDEDHIVKELSSYQLFLEPEKVEGWVKLRRFDILEESEFERIIKDELEKLEKCQISNIEEFLTFMSDIFYFDKEEIYKSDINAILEYAHNQIIQIIKQADSFKSIKTQLISCMHTHKLPEKLISFLEEAKHELEKCELKEIEKDIQKYFSALDKGDTTFLYYIDTESPKYNSSIKSKPYLKYLDPSRFYSNLLKLKNADLKNVYDYFIERYKKNNYPEIYYQEELPFITTVRDLLASHSYVGIKGYWLKRIKKVLDTVIEQIKPSEALQN